MMKAIRLIPILAFIFVAAPSSATTNGIIPFGSSDPSVIFQSTLASPAAITAVSGGSVTGAPNFDPTLGIVPGATGGAYFQGNFLAAQNAGQLSLEVETTLITVASPDFVGGIGGSQGYDHTADGWQTLLDIHSADGTAIATLGLTNTAGIGGNYRGVTIAGLGIHSAGKSGFVRLTLSWSAAEYALYVDGLQVLGGSGAGLDIGQIAAGYSEPGAYGVRNYHIRNIILSSQPVVYPVHPSLGKIVIYGDSFASQSNPILIGSTNFESTAGFQLLRDMNNTGMSIGQMVLKDYQGETLNRNPEPGIDSFQVGPDRFGGSADKLADVVNENADYVIIMGGTNDAAGDASARGMVAPNFATDLLSMCRTILNNPQTKGIMMQTIMSLKGYASYAIPANVGYVASINAAIAALPSVWDATYPNEGGEDQGRRSFHGNRWRSGAGEHGERYVNRRTR
ncbi:MAG: SGNH/GDSL hydrolase family protein [Steroidobacteraceae bacterium]